MPPSCDSSLNWSCLPAPSHLTQSSYAPHAILMMAGRWLLTDLATQTTPKGDAQSAETFRVVGMDGTDRGRPKSFESNSGLRSALCPLSFLGRLKPFFSFSAGERKEWVQKSVSLGVLGDRRLQRCTETAPRPSSVCFADTFPGGEGNPLRRGWGGQGGGLYFVYPCGGGDHGWRLFSVKFFKQA